MHRSSKIRDRLFECLEKGDITMGDEIAILQHIVQRLNLSTISAYARKHGISPNGAKKRVEANREASVILNGQLFIID